MHTLHRPHLARIMTVTVIAAVLAIVLTLALATGLNDLASTAAPTAPAGTQLQVSPTGHASNLSPFAPLLSAPAPWAPALL
jgi:hypothetical protein